MKKSTLTLSQMGQLLNISPAAVSGLVKRGRLIRDSVGLIDLKIPENRAFVTDRGIDLGKVKIPDIGPTGRPVVPAKQGQVTSPRPETSRTNAELQKKLLEKKVEKISIEIDRQNKILLPTDFIENALFRYLEKLNSNIERAAGVAVQDIGAEILEAGEILPAHIQKFTNLILTAIHETKLSIMKEIEKYDPS